MQDFNKVVRNDDSGLAVRVWGVEKKIIRALGVFPGVLIGKVRFYFTVSILVHGWVFVSTAGHHFRGGGFSY